MRLDVEKLGTTLVVVLTLWSLASLGVYASLKETVADLHAQVAVKRGDAEQPSRSPFGQQLSAVFASDIASENLVNLEARGLELDHRADRLLEATAVVALAGMLVALVSGRPPNELAHAGENQIPLASTSSNGAV